MEQINRNGHVEDEKQLLKRVAHGDREAFRGIYEQTYGKVAHYIRGFVNDQTIAEDVVIQTYAIAWQKAANFRGEGRVTTWLIGIARNIAFKEFRKQRLTTPFDESYISADTSSCREAERKDISQKLKETLAILSQKHREILELVFFQGLSYGEISAIIDIPVNTVKTRVFHAKKALKDELIKRDITQNDFG